MSKAIAGLCLNEGFDLEKQARIELELATPLGCRDSRGGARQINKL